MGGDGEPCDVGAQVLSVAPGGIALAEAGVILGAFATGAGIVFKVPNVSKAE